MPLKSLPSLPQDDTAEAKAERAFQLSVAKTKYNYMSSYLEGVPLSADVPKGEEFSLEYKAGVLPVFLALADNFKNNVIELLEKELRDDIDNDIFQEIKASYEKLQHMSAFHLKEDIQGLKDFIKSLTKLPVAIDDALKIPKDLAKMLSGIEAVIEEVKEEGTTALLKSTLYELLNNDGKRDYLKASDNQDYRDLYQSFATPPLTVSIENKPWMESDKEPYQQDWFFGYLQTAGFNTTNLLAVREDHQEAKSAVVLASLLEKMPLTDQILQSVLNDNNVSLASAVAQKKTVCLRLYHASRQKK
jgi:arachidonate 15-lipoxygenase